MPNSLSSSDPLSFLLLPSSFDSTSFVSLDDFLNDELPIPQSDPPFLISPSDPCPSAVPSDSPTCSTAAAAPHHHDNSPLIYGSGITSLDEDRMSRILDQVLDQGIRGNSSCCERVNRCGGGLRVEMDEVGSLDGWGKNGLASCSGGGGSIWRSAADGTGIGSRSNVTNENNIMKKKKKKDSYYYYNYNSGSYCGSSYGSSWDDAAASPPDVSSLATATAAAAAAAAAALPSPKRQKTTTLDHMNDQTNCETIGILVQTHVINLHDGYVWRKYGEKRIKNHDHTRSYFRCASSGCKIQKQIQRQSSNTIMFTYIGRHNHHVS